MSWYKKSQRNKLTGDILTMGIRFEYVVSEHFTGPNESPEIKLVSASVEGAGDFGDFVFNSEWGSGVWGLVEKSGRDITDNFGVIPETVNVEYKGVVMNVKYSTDQSEYELLAAVITNQIGFIKSLPNNVISSIIEDISLRD